MISTIRFAEVPGGKKPRYFLRLKKLMGLLGDAQAGVHCRPPPKSWCAYDWAAYLPTGFRFRAALKFWVLAALAGQNMYRTRFFGHKFELSGLLHSGFLPGDTCVVRTA